MVNMLQYWALHDYDFCTDSHWITLWKWLLSHYMCLYAHILTHWHRRAAVYRVKLQTGLRADSGSSNVAYVRQDRQNDWGVIWSRRQNDYSCSSAVAALGHSGSRAKALLFILNGAVYGGSRAKPDSTVHVKYKFPIHAWQICVNVLFQMNTQSYKAAWEGINVSTYLKYTYPATIK